MEYETISILAEKGETGTIISTVKGIQFKNPDLSIGSPRYGQLSNRMIISYRVPKNQHKQIVSLFTMRDLKIITRDEDVLNIISNTRKTIIAENISSGQTQPLSENDSKIKKPTMGIVELEDFAKRGNYQEIIKISKDIINYGTDMVDRAKNVLSEAVKVSITNAYNSGMMYPSKVDESVDLLLKIASDVNLKSMNKMDILRQAGMLSIDICVKHIKYIDKLISICNFNSIPHIINLKAAVKFSEVVFENKEQFKDDLDIAVRDLNNKWIAICNDVAGRELSAEEVTALNKLLDYVQLKR